MQLAKEVPDSYYRSLSPSYKGRQARNYNPSSLRGDIKAPTHHTVGEGRPYHEGM
jgi:hypothetical protein